VAATWPELQKLTLPTALLDFAHQDTEGLVAVRGWGALSGYERIGAVSRPNAARVCPRCMVLCNPCAAKSPQYARRPFLHRSARLAYRARVSHNP